MRGVALRFLTRKRGFTLVEILIAVAILGIVAAVAVPTVANIKSRSEAKANAGELMNVASALHSMMSDQELDSVTAIPQASATNAMNAFPDGTYPLHSGATGDYLRGATTKCTYYVTTAGRVSQDSC